MNDQTNNQRHLKIKKAENKLIIINNFNESLLYELRFFYIITTKFIKTIKTIASSNVDQMLVKRLISQLKCFFKSI